MIVRNPPQHFTPEWLPRMRERRTRAWKRQMESEMFKQQAEILERQICSTARDYIRAQER